VSFGEPPPYFPPQAFETQELKPERLQGRLDSGQGETMFLDVEKQITAFAQAEEIRVVANRHHLAVTFVRPGDDVLAAMANALGLGQAARLVVLARVINGLLKR
jgi:hypothetical protein